MRRYSGLIAACGEPPPNAVVASPALAPKHPLLLYFPGWAATAVDNVTLIERLAGSGFIVAAIHYPARVMGLSSAVAKRQRAVVEKPMDFSSAQAFADTIELAEHRVRARAADAGAVLDAIASARLDDVDRRLLACIDLDRVGIFGFSLGGAVAAEASLRDHRFRAAVNLDGWHFGEALERGVPRPYLFISDDTPLPTTRDLISPRPGRRYGAMLNRKNHEQLTINLARHGGHLLTIAGSRHENFADRLYRTGIRWLVRRRRITSARVLQIVFDCSRSFFAEHLKGEGPASLNTVAATYPEARLRSWPRASGVGAYPTQAKA
jgi:dienelactone hydrolase